MKKIGAIVLMLALMSMMVLAKPVSKDTYTIDIDLDGDGTFETVIVEEGVKVTKRATTISRSFFTEGYLDYLGMELLVNGEVVKDTFIYN